MLDYFNLIMLNHTEQGTCSLEIEGTVGAPSIPHPLASAAAFSGAWQAIVTAFIFSLRHIHN